eukprot:CAMPEP_0179149926 /NCGR_PEP_ID=MMETSP0796-20121207/72670_1 /TAXON_ID=73915 /ORGANISM="Pyrodinium bahamense, Strain pbaha01" /LENGTH=257 /DNA_ID=CAMNT_0020850829 /DNA_START=11 /DNA_END=782 /DNA_ORIENTATION=-
MQLAEMAVTPLACGDWMCPALQVSCQGGRSEATLARSPVAAASSEAAAWARSDRAACAPDGTQPTTGGPVQTEPAEQPAARSPAQPWRLPALEPEDRSHQASQAAAVTRYESVDPLTGRVWGMPSAFGRAQCRDCPEKAAPPSDRCVCCQRCLAEAVHEPMESEALQQLKGAFDGLLARPSGRPRDDVAGRLRKLYAQLEKGRIPRPVQEQLLEVTAAVLAKNVTEARKACSRIAAQHWSEHKAWLTGLEAFSQRSD